MFLLHTYGVYYNASECHRHLEVGFLATLSRIPKQPHKTAVFWRKCKNEVSIYYSNTFMFMSLETIMVLWRFQVFVLSGWRQAEFEHSFFLNECCEADRVMAVLLFSVSASQSSIMLTHTLPPPALKPHDNQRNYHISTSPSLLFFPSLFVCQSVWCFLLLSSLLLVYISPFLWRCALFKEIKSCFTWIQKQCSPTAVLAVILIVECWFKKKCLFLSVVIVIAEVCSSLFSLNYMC